MNPESSPDLDAAIASYLQAVEAGQVPNRQEWLDAHPDLADPLRAFFADLDRMDCMAAPLRIDASSDATIDLQPLSIAPSLIRYFGDYELLEEIAHGGMGIVYKARQTNLNRVVALKMILKGALATPQDVLRFRAEAESVSELDHPNIVPIYEVNEHEGQQYFTMRFIDGGPLNNTPRGTIRAEVERLRTIARAVSFAHLRGILHRDLKPSNILLDAEGTPYVTDFGLAKKLENPERSLTETGQVLGTPRYMAPEQAAGRKDLTVAADVYSLGAILYERLAGRPAFAGDNVLTLLRQVRETEAPPLSTIVPLIDRDLDTLVRKSLEKDPRTRYSTADDFGDELDRWLKGEPIVARPVSQAERLRRWCIRNPALATAGGVAIVGMVLATITSIGLASQSRARAKAEGEKRQVAQKAEKDAITAQDAAENLLACSLVKSFNPDDPFNPAVSFHEAEALWELARESPNGLGLRAIDAALRDPSLLTQLRGRCEPAMIAAVGLDESLRDHAAEKLAVWLGDSTRSLDEKVVAAMMALELAAETGPLSATCASALLKVDGNRPNLMQHIMAQYCFNRNDPWRGRIKPADVAKQAAEALADPPTENKLIRMDLALGLAAVAAKMPPADAARVCADAAKVLADAMAGEQQDDFVLGFLAVGLSAVAAKMPPADAARVCADAAEILADAMANPRHDYSPAYLANGLAAVAERMTPADADKVIANAAKVLADILARQKDGDYQGTGQGLAAIAKRMPPADAARVCADAAKVLADAMSRERDGLARAAHAQGLAILAARLTSDAARQACSQAIRGCLDRPSSISLARTATFETRRPYFLAIAVSLSHMEQREAHEIARLLSFEIAADQSGTRFIEFDMNASVPMLEDILPDNGREERRRHAERLAEAWLDGDDVTFALIDAEPYPCRLSTPDLVELLKMPTLFGASRRVVLDHLGNRYGRKFANHWQFVRFAKEKGLDLDFTSPPARPDPRALRAKVLEILETPQSK